MTHFDIEAARERANTLRADVDGIDAQLSVAKDEVALGLRDPEAYLAWKKSAVAARNYKLDELRRLKEKIDLAERVPVRRWLKSLVEIARDCGDDLDIEEIEMLDSIDQFLNRSTNGAAA